MGFSQLILTSHEQIPGKTLVLIKIVYHRFRGNAFEAILLICSRFVLSHPDDIICTLCRRAVNTIHCKCNHRCSTGKPEANKKEHNSNLRGGNRLRKLVQQTESLHVSVVASWPSVQGRWGITRRAFVGHF